LLHHGDRKGGELTPERFGELFPRTKLVVFNTYNHTPEKPRFQVVFPFDQPLNPDQYELLYDNLIAKIKDAGFGVGHAKSVPASGLDLIKKTPTSLFYLPCQAKQPTDSFFYDLYHDDSRETLDPKNWIEHSVIPFSRPAIRHHQSGRTFDQAKLDNATSIWRDSINYPGEGGTRFWKYALELWAAGMDFEQIETQLQNESGNGRTPSKRRKQIPSILKSLRQSNRRAG
jgi:hypothetical protein